MILEIKDASYDYGPEVAAVKDVGFSVDRGEQVAILGANGSGKSTLLAMLDGLIFPTSGDIRAFGEPLTEEALRDTAVNREFRRRVGFVFQDSDAQLFNPTVREEVAFGPLQLGLSADEAAQRTDEVLRTLGLEKIADRPPFLLSGGEKRRVALASVLSLDPEVLLLDEPSGGLDPRTQVWLQELLWQLADEGKTVLLATHDLALAEDCSVRALVLSESHTLAADRPVADIMADPDLLLAANLIHAHAHRHEREEHVHPHRHEYGHAHRH